MSGSECAPGEVSDEPEMSSARTASTALRLVRHYKSSGELSKSLGIARTIYSDRYKDSETRAAMAEFLSTDVPDYHLSLVQDQARNDAYEAALRRAVRPGMRVLDIGSGTGLLAMMAARAGAAKVFTCEMNPAVAAAARDVIALNGFADRIETLSMHSTAIDAERDLGGRVDVIVSEIVSNDVLFQDILATMDHAVRELLVSGGRVIPSRCEAIVALAEDPRADRRQMSTASGFDLSAFNRLIPPVKLLRSDEVLPLRSEPVTVFDFDLASAEPVAGARVRCTVTPTGPFDGIAQWIRIRMDDEGVYENRPGSISRSCWAVRLHRLDRVAGRAGDVVIGASHDRHRLTLWIA